MDVASALIPGYLAHILVRPFSLPLPVWLFVFGGVAIVLLSFVVISLIADDKPRSPKQVATFKLPYTNQLEKVAKFVGVFCLLLVIITGLFGTPLAGKNFNVIFCWIIFSVGFTYITAVFGNLWKAINPFLTIVSLTERTSKQSFDGIKKYPAKLGYYPALGIYFIIICLELLFGEFGSLPQTLSGLLICYTLLSLMGSMTFGKKAWFTYADFFSVFFGLISKISPFEYKNRRVNVRPPLRGLLDIKLSDSSLVLFICFMLASTMFDGLQGTQPYYKLEGMLPSIFWDKPYGVVALIALTATLFGLYRLFSELVRGTIPTKLSGREISLAFAPSLIPIALGYNVAHYFSYLVVNIQVFYAYLSDPLNRGWNLFGTADTMINAAVFSPQTIWYIQLFAIVTGHVIAVYVCHKIAQTIYKNWSDVVHSQLPIVVLMMLYTLLALWIIAQPLYTVGIR